MNPLSYLVQRWRELSPEGQRIIGIGIGALLIFLTLLIAFRLTTKSFNGTAFEFMLELFPQSAKKPIFTGPVSKAEIASLKDQITKLAPQSPDLQKARRHLLKALGYLYEELEAEGEFARAAQNRQYEKAEILSKRMEESRKLYLSELRKAKLYMENFSRRTGRPAINIQLPE